MIPAVHRGAQVQPGPYAARAHQGEPAGGVDVGDHKADLVDMSDTIIRRRRRSSILQSVLKRGITVNRAFLKELLATMILGKEYDVLFANSGIEALEKLRHEQVDLRVYFI